MDRLLTDEEFAEALFNAPDDDSEITDYMLGAQDIKTRHATLEEVKGIIKHLNTAFEHSALGLQDVGYEVTNELKVVNNFVDELLRLLRDWRSK